MSQLTFTHNTSTCNLSKVGLGLRIITIISIIILIIC